MIISTLGNLFLCVFLLSQNLLYTGCNLTASCSSSSFCNSPLLTRFACILGFLSFVLFEPMSVIPYWARTIRIYKIFKAQQYYFETKKKPGVEDR